MQGLRLASSNYLVRSGLLCSVVLRNITVSVQYNNIMQISQNIPTSEAGERQCGVVGHHKMCDLVISTGAASLQWGMMKI